MKKLTFLLIIFSGGFTAQAQFVYKIKADSVLITNDSCTAELNLENSTKNVLGFLYNKGKGRTEFRKGLIKFGDSLFTLGTDTVNLTGSGPYWSLTGNAGANYTTKFLGTTDNNHLIIKTNNIERMRIRSDDGNIGIGTNPVNKLHIYGANAMIFIEGDSNSYYPGIKIKSAGQRYGYVDPYGIVDNWFGGMHLNTTTAFGRSAVGASSSGVKSVSTDSTVITHQVTGAQRQAANIFDVSENISTIPGGHTPSSLLAVKNTGKLVLSKYQNSAGEDSVLTTDANGNVKLKYGGPVINYTVQSLTDNATITWNVANGVNGVVTLGGTGRTLSITNPVAGQTYTIRIIQDSTGSRTITTWPTNSKWPNGTTPTLSTVANRYDIVVFYYDGTNYYGTYQQNFQ